MAKGGGTESDNGPGWETSESSAMRWKRAAALAQKLPKIELNSPHKRRQKKQEKKGKKVRSSSSLTEVHSKRSQLQLLQPASGAPNVSSMSLASATRVKRHRRQNLIKLTKLKHAREHDFGLGVYNRIHRSGSKTFMTAFQRQNDLLMRI
jgi:hypothetical protein